MLEPTGTPPDSLCTRARSRWQAWLRLPLMLPKLLRTLLLLTFFVLGVALLLLRYLGAPQIAAHRVEIEQTLSQAIGLPVRIEQLEANWDGLRPELAIRNVQVLDKAGRPALELPAVNVAVAWSSLWHFGLRLHRLEIIRPELAVRREADGRLFVAGLAMNTGGEGSGAADFVLQQDQILIRDARLTWADAQRSAPPLTLDKVSLRLENSGRRHRFALQASPPAAYSANLDLRGDLRGRSFAELEDWRGTVYTSLDEADLAVWQQWVDYPLGLTRGRGGLRAWASFDALQLTGLTADVALAEVSLRFGKDIPQLDLHALQGRVRLSRRDGGIDLAAERLSLAAQDGLQVGPTTLSLRYVPARAGREARGEFATSAQDVKVLAQLASFLPLPEEQRRQLVLADPSGRIEDVKLSWEGSAAKPVEHFTLAARFADLHLHPVGHIPGFKGLSGQLSGSERSGEFRLGFKQGGLYLPHIMHEPFMVLDQAELKGRWGYEPAPQDKVQRLTVRLDRLQASNPDVQAEASGYWQARASGPGYLDVRARAPEARLDAVWRYIPAVAPVQAVDWLRSYLQGGRGESLAFQLTGELNQFPFNHAPGVFKLEAGLRDALISEFYSGWPGMNALQGSFLLDRQRMTIRADSGRYGAATARGVKVEIPDLMDQGKQVLTVDGKASGPNPDFLRYVNGSHLLANLVGSFTRNVRASGNGELNLHIEIPLHESIHTRVRGDYRFQAPSLQLIPALPEFTEASATLGFTEKGISLPAAGAMFLGRRVRATGVTEADGNLRFDAQGSMTASGLDQLVRNPAWRHLGGETPVALVIRVRHGLLDLSADTSLIGISSSLPAPFAKPASEAWPLNFSLRQEKRETLGGQNQIWRVRLDKRLDVAWSERCGDTPCQFTSGALAVGETATLPMQGWRFSGVAPQVDVNPWIPVVDEFMTGFASGSGGQSQVAAAFRVGELRVGGYRFRDQQGKALRRGNDWSLQLDGPDMAGELSWGELGAGNLRARLKRLNLQHPAGVAEIASVVDVAESTSGRQLPALDVEAEHFSTRNIDFGQLKLRAVNDGQLWKLEQVSLKTPDLEFTGSGHWQRVGLKPGTHLDFSLHSEDAGAMLARLGFAGMVDKGTVDFEGKAEWRGAPTAIDYPSLSGSLKLEARKGRFRQMDPGAGRLLGIMSLQSLPRRLTLDFSDIYAQGFAFDRISGEMSVAAGVLHTNDLEVRGPAARVFITGNTDLGREQHDLQVMVQPTLSETVAVGGALAVGVFNPLIGAATYVAQKILLDPVEKMFSYEYQVRGPWAEPRVDKISTLKAAVQSGVQSGVSSAEEGDK
ncbi:YhdP family protein [Uliginosibacterium sp. TH139]|uniref:YhdP family protein n=1 Tax=Uliginosibacterium sp. TH139 TaxID=2067453 RepID=UPI000C798093|nr:YhdP family protein [Uliginosibacterium sp. TH139]PLK49828.1 TIGR02099 family protein [Uliginosibacterium sp. TH139]